MDELTLVDKAELAKRHTKINALLKERKALQDEVREYWDKANAVQKKVDELDKRITEEAIKVEPTVSVKGVPSMDKAKRDAIDKIAKAAQKDSVLAAKLAEVLGIK